MIIWTASTGDAGAADTRALAATEATTEVLGHWGRQHPLVGGAEGVRICVDDTDTYVGPALDHHGLYDPTSTTTMMNQVRDDLAQPRPETELADPGDLGERAW